MNIQVNNWLGFKCFAAETLDAPLYTREDHDEVCLGNNSDYNVVFLNRKHRFHDHYRHIETDFVDNLDLIEKVSKRNENHKRQQDMVKNLCRNITSDATVRKLEVSTIILPGLGVVFFLQKMFMSCFHP